MNTVTLLHMFTPFGSMIERKEQHSGHFFHQWTRAATEIIIPFAEIGVCLPWSFLCTSALELISIDQFYSDIFVFVNSCIVYF